jgi:hypothetical protein
MDDLPRLSFIVRLFTHDNNQMSRYPYSAFIAPELGSDWLGSTGLSSFALAGTEHTLQDLTVHQRTRLVRDVGLTQ